MSSQPKHHQRFSPRTKSITMTVRRGSGYLQPEPPPMVNNCRGCGLPFDVTAKFQSQLYCEHCRPVPCCVHKIKVTEPCPACKAKTGSFFIRNM
jgi:hypothetical protein